MKRLAYAILALASSACSSEHTARVYPEGEVVDAPAPLYPAGPYQLLKDYVVPDLCFKGYRDGIKDYPDGKPPLVQICLHDFWDPDGSRGINAVFIAENAEWCSPCNQLASRLDNLDATYHARGGRFMTVVAESASPAGTPATQSTLDAWVHKYKLVVDAAIDPDHTLMPRGAGVPTMFLIDPRTMKIVRVNPGLDFSVGASPVGFEDLLKKNGG
ncbi:MAG: hypothetical protein ACXVEF_43705 [Polyangiales bacterium]